MADSPLCPACKAREVKSNTFKVAGRAQFKCGTCKNTFHSGQFKDGDFLWRVTNGPLPKGQVTE